MERKTITSCYISAPWGIDLTIFKEILKEHNIVAIDPSQMESNGPIAEWTNNAINTSDIFFSILPDDKMVNNVLFETGIAFAKNKPILLFVGRNFKLPLNLAQMRYLHSIFENKESIRLYIESFLNFGIINEEKKSQRKPIENVIDEFSFDNEQEEIRRKSGFEFEKNIENIFKEAGYLTESQKKISNRHLDIAIWIDNFENFFGNPVLVEVKYGRLNNEKMKDAENRLRKQLKKTGGRLGLLIYNDNRGRQFSDLSKGWPLVIKFSSDELVNLLKANKFESTIIALRNRIAHGLL